MTGLSIRSLWPRICHRPLLELLRASLKTCKSSKVCTMKGFNNSWQLDAIVTHHFGFSNVLLMQVWTKKRS